MRLFVTGLLVALLAACSGTEPSIPDSGQPIDGAADAGIDDSGATDSGTTPVNYVTHLDSLLEMGQLHGELKPGVKYLAPVAVPREPPLTEDCYFQNMNLFDWHIEFLQSFEEFADLSVDTYTAWVLKEASRRYFGGDIRLWPGVRHPRTNLPGIISYVAYSDPAEALELEDIQQIDARLKSCMPFATDLLVYVPANDVQEFRTRQIRTEIENAGIAVLFAAELIEGVEFEAYSQGVGYGFLKIVPEGEPLGNYGPRDVIVVNSAPNDVSIVAGFVTANPQNPASHVNLRLLEKNIPNAAVPAVYQNSVITGLNGQLVRIEVTSAAVEIRPAPLSEAEAFWEANRPVVPPVESDLSVTQLGSLNTIRHADALAYGAKAANLGELSAALPAEHRPPGFAIPFARYNSFMVSEGLDTLVADILSDPRIQTDRLHRRDRLRTLRDEIKTANFPPDLYTEVSQAIANTFGVNAATTRIRFRSSTNVEDLDSLTGAGLYDSKSGCLADDEDGNQNGPSACVDVEERAFEEARLAQLQAELAANPDRIWLTPIILDIEGDLANEKPVQNAIRKVWASLWNLRAFDERDYYGIDHTQVYMGIAVHPSFVLEQVNAVALTNLPTNDARPLYQLISQVGYESVVRPTIPTAVAERLTFRQDGQSVVDVVRQTNASLSPGGAPLWTQQEIETMGGLLFSVEAHFSANVYPQLDPLRLDLEIKKDRAGQIVIKQVRPYLGGSTP